MTDSQEDKVKELAEKWVTIEGTVDGRYQVFVGGVSHDEWDTFNGAAECQQFWRDEFARFGREAHAEGRKQGLEEAAKRLEYERKFNEKQPRMRQSEFDRGAVSAFTNGAAEIRRLANPSTEPTARKESE